MEKYVKNGIYYTDSSFTTIDLGYYESIKKVANTCLWASIWTIIFTIVRVISMVCDSSPTIAVITTLLYGALFLGLGCWTHYGLRHRKPYSIFMARATFLIFLVSWILLFFNGAFELTLGNLFFGVIALLWGCHGLYSTLFLEDFKTVFPNHYRRTNIIHYAYVAIMILLPFLIGGFLRVKEAVSSDRDRLEQVIENINKECPVGTEAGRIMSVTLVDHKVEFKCSVPNVAYSLYAGPQTKSFGRKYALSVVSLVAIMQSERIDLPERYGLVALMVSEKIELKVTVISNETNETVSFDFSSQEVKQKLSVIDNSKQVMRMLMDISIEMGNLQCPQIVDEGLTQIKISFEDDIIKYIYSVDENIYDISYFQNNKSEIRNIILQNLQSDPTSASILNNCKNFEIGLVYRYIGSFSKEIHDVIVIDKE